jgi:hypothetical protein
MAERLLPRGYNFFTVDIQWYEPGAANTRVPIAFAQSGIKGAAQVRDLWQRRAVTTTRGSFAPAIPCHGAGLYRLSPV